MISFSDVQLQDSLKNMIHNIFDLKLDVEGGWGYSKSEATIFYDLPVSLSQLQHNLVHMRAYIEMNIMQDKESRYSSINVIEKYRESVDDYERVVYEVSAMLEDDYNSFIDEYKRNYGKDDFDISEHFAKRKKATLVREVVYWFDLAEI